MSPLTIILIIVVILALAGAAWVILDRRRSERLRTKFGPEYDLAVQNGNRWRAESALEKRVKRVEKFPIRMLTPEEQARFQMVWKKEQARFVDDPRLAVRNADRLVNEVMASRGYPMSEFDQRAEDLSVHHPQLIKNYRVAHGVAVRDARDGATTEDLREAMVCYRALFLDLLEQTDLESVEVRG